MESKVKAGNYYVVQSFMVKDFQLKGLEKDIYAIIYGFSQTDNQTFTGSLQYLADWTNASKQGILKAINCLIEKGLIAKKEKFINNVKFVEYYSTEFNGVLNKVEQGIKQCLPNNIDNNIDNNNINNAIVEIISYLNVQADMNYRNSSNKTRTLIKSRMNEGYSVDDFKKVIDNKIRDWKNTEFEKFIRPETLFGNKFESYLNQNIVLRKTTLPMREYSKEETQSLYDDVHNIIL